jgi:hypothetical protein
MSRSRPQDQTTFTMRLTADDQQQLVKLCHHYGLNRPDSLRRAMCDVLKRPTQGRLTSMTGIFTPFSRLMRSPLRIPLVRKAENGYPNTG